MTRAVSTLVFALILAVAGLSATAGVASAAGSAPGKPPSGGVKVLGEHFVTYCVSDYKPNSDVKVVNKLTGQVFTVHVDKTGKGCVQLPVSRACHASTITVVATGVDPNGKAATVTSTMSIIADRSKCATKDPSAAASVLPFTGSGVVAPAALMGFALVFVGGLAMVLARRRREHTIR